MACADLVQTVPTYLPRMQMFGGDVVDRNGVTILHAERPYIPSYVRAGPVVRGPARFGSYRKWRLMFPYLPPQKHAALSTSVAVTAVTQEDRLVRPRGPSRALSIMDCTHFGI